MNSTPKLSFGWIKFIYKFLLYRLYDFIDIYYTCITSSSRVKPVIDDVTN